MDEKAWTGAIVTLFDFFRVEKLPTDSQIKKWFEMVKHISNSSIDSIIHAICHEYDSLPRNLPKAFLEKSHGTPQHLRQKSYDITEDFSFPVNLMHQGYDILDKKGADEFSRFAKAVSMPLNDRDRIFFKLRVVRAGKQPDFS